MGDRIASIHGLNPKGCFEVDSLSYFLKQALKEYPDGDYGKSLNR
jgi:hypothetical protein